MVRGIYDPCFTKKAFKKNWSGKPTPEQTAALEQGDNPELSLDQRVA